MGEPVRVRMSPLEYLGPPLVEVRAKSVVDAVSEITIAEAPFAGQLTMRAKPGSPAAERAGELLGGALPTKPNTARRLVPYDVLWMGPDEWLVVTPDGEQGELEVALRRAFAGHHAAVTDVSAQRTVIEVGGDAARTILAKG